MRIYCNGVLSILPTGVYTGGRVSCPLWGFQWGPLGFCPLLKVNLAPPLDKYRPPLNRQKDLLKKKKITNWGEGELFCASSEISSTLNKLSINNPRGNKLFALRAKYLPPPDRNPEDAPVVRFKFAWFQGIPLAIYVHGEMTVGVYCPPKKGYMSLIKLT